MRAVQLILILSFHEGLFYFYLREPWKYIKTVFSLNSIVFVPNLSSNCNLIKTHLFSVF